MNKVLLKILDRHELDKPILMSDKLDIIWDKNDKVDNSKYQRKDPDKVFERVLDGFNLTAEQVKINKEARA